MQINHKINKKKKIFRHMEFFILLVSFVFILFYAFSYNLPQQKFDYDEVDYIAAADLGIIANAFERGSLNLKSFILFGLSKISDAEESNDKTFENLISEDSDPFLLRHFHPPLPVYYWSLFSKLSIVGIAQDTFLKISGLVIYLIFCLTFMGVLKATGQKTEINKAQSLFLIIFFTSPLLINTSLNLNFHIFHSVACILFSYALVNYLKRSNNQDAYILGIAITFLILTIETWLVVVFFGIMIALLYQGRVFFHAQRLLKAIFSMVISILIFWPGVLWTGGPLKSFGMHANRVFMSKGGGEFDFSKFLLLKDLLLTNPLLSFFTLCICLLLLKNCYKDLATMVPLTLGISLLLFISGFAHFHSYFLPAITLIVLAASTALKKIKHEK
jgi:hypothetical protein